MAPGATAVVSPDFRVLSGSQAPPDGSVITLAVSADEAGFWVPTEWCGGADWTGAQDDGAGARRMYVLVLAAD